MCAQLAKPPIIPDVMIPFWEQDLCKMSWTARSLAHDRFGQLGRILFVWVSTRPPREYQTKIDAILNFTRLHHHATFMDFSPHLLAEKDLGGWYAQQALKLKIASVISSEFYLVMDAKNTFIKDMPLNLFVSPCNVGKVFGAYLYDQIPVPHSHWYAASARALGIQEPAEGFWPTSVTPMMIHTETAIRMLNHIGENTSTDAICEGPLCKMLGAHTITGSGATEFTMYLTYARSLGNFKCNHVVDVPTSSNLAERWAVSLWRGEENRDKDLHRARLIAKEGQVPAMFGVQASALEGMNCSQKQQATQLIADIYFHGGLHDYSASADSIVNCVAGRTTTTTSTTTTFFCCFAAPELSDFCGTCYQEAVATKYNNWCGGSENRCHTCRARWCKRSFSNPSNESEDEVDKCADVKALGSVLSQDWLATGASRATATAVAAAGAMGVASLLACGWVVAAWRGRQHCKAPTDPEHIALVVQPDLAHEESANGLFWESESDAEDALPAREYTPNFGGASTGRKTGWDSHRDLKLVVNK
jgi:hypothetical protein